MYFDWNTDGSRYLYVAGRLRPSSSQSSNASCNLTANVVLCRGKSEAVEDRFRGLRFSPDRRSLSFRGIAGIRLLDVEASRVRVVHDELPENPGWPVLRGRAGLVVQRARAPSPA